MVFLSVQLKSFYWPAEMKVTIKKNTQTSPLTTVQPTGVGTPPITLPAIPTAGRHIMHWSKERTWKLQHYLPMCGFLVHSENGIWFDGSSGHHWQVARGVGGGNPFTLNPKDVGGGLAISTFLEGFQPRVDSSGWNVKVLVSFLFLLEGQGVVNLARGPDWGHAPAPKVWMSTVISLPHNLFLNTNETEN